MHTIEKYGSEFEDAIKQDFKIYSSSNRLKRLKIKVKVAISDDFKNIYVFSIYYKSCKFPAATLPLSSYFSKLIFCPGNNLFKPHF